MIRHNDYAGTGALAGWIAVMALIALARYGGELLTWLGVTL